MNRIPGIFFWAIPQYNIFTCICSDMDKLLKLTIFLLLDNNFLLIKIRPVEKLHPSLLVCRNKGTTRGRFWIFFLFLSHVHHLTEVNKNKLYQRYQKVVSELEPFSIYFIYLLFQEPT